MTPKERAERIMEAIRVAIVEGNNDEVERRRAAEREIQRLTAELHVRSYSDPDRFVTLPEACRDYRSGFVSGWRAIGKDDSTIPSWNAGWRDGRDAAEKAILEHMSKC